MLNEQMNKAEVYTEQGRTDEAQAVNEEAMKQVMPLVARVCPLCCSLCCVFLFDIGWMIYGWVMYYDNEGCDKMTTYFMRLVLISCACQIVIQIISWKMESPSEASP
eukprot:gnl/TRDRNA2_/TRDRNA2_211020_c0_seq1.p1 gnl/TRDRNA2_/TRDRNA2_211020_c0~~gnl/TRDRNA2_/TRDRNA2_211020_c0_seq1.p1  ORF type:complete len:119 (-),score=11.94 gnl/TRDRNA2_/TRDRNA2_211020_c0_seq1:68-388(-)